MEKQKQLITEIMNEDAKDGLYKQQTAVEWLREQFHKVPQSQFGNLFKQAKQIERNQIIDAVGVGSQLDRGYLYAYHDKAEQYYTQTYGQ